MRGAALFLAASLATAVGIAAVAAQSYASGATPDQAYKITATSTGTWSTTFPRPTRSADPIVEAKRFASTCSGGPPMWRTADSRQGPG